MKSLMTEFVYLKLTPEQMAAQVEDEILIIERQHHAARLKRARVADSNLSADKKAQGLADVDRQIAQLEVDRDAVAKMRGSEEQ